MEELIKMVWDNNAILVFDTNVLLNFYSYQYNDVNNLLNVIRKYKNRVWIPRQVYNEYIKSRKRIMTKVFRREKEIKEDIDNIFSHTINRLNKVKEKYNRLNYNNLEKLINKVANKLNETFDAIKDIDTFPEIQSNDGNKYKSKDPIEEFIEELEVEGRIGRGFKYSELLKIYSEGEFRYNNRIPPGFSDSGNKEFPDKYGDLVIWKEILEFGESEKLDIIFVCDENKNDWWDQKNGSKQLSESIINEFSCYSDKKFVFINSYQFKNLIFEFENDDFNTIALYFETNKYEIISELIEKETKSKIKPIINNECKTMLNDLYSVKNIIIDEESLNDIKYKINDKDIYIYVEYKIQIYLEDRYSFRNEIYASACSRFSINKSKYTERTVNYAETEIINIEWLEGFENLDIYTIYDYKLAEEQLKEPYNPIIGQVFDHIEFIPYEEEYLGEYDEYRGTFIEE